MIAFASSATAFVCSTHVAAGSDAYGYVSQADLWLNASLFIDQSFAADAPWPMARWTFTPLGYRPEVDGYRIVPAYAPGLSMLMAVAKRIAGQCAVYWIVPLAAAVLVIATYRIAETTAPSTGLAAAWLVATSPTVLYMSMAPMSDVPAAAAWAVAVALAVGTTTFQACAAGLSAAVAILIRPNLAPLAAVVAIWLAFRRGARAAAIFAFAAGIGAVVIAIVNTRLYGSPWRSGYDLLDAFATANIVPNIKRYGGWLIEVETPVAVAGLVWLVWTGQWLLAAFAAVVWGLYLTYVPWDAWWYLRFLLPSWPMMAVGTALLLRRLPRVAASMAMVALGLAGVVQAARRGAFAEAAGESKYVEVARVVESLTEPSAVIVSAQHSGTLRYYAGRLTLRWDTGDLGALDRSVDWLNARGRHVYLVLEEPELEAMRAKAAGASAVARADWNPMVTFRGGAIKLFDTVNRQHEAPPISNKPSWSVDPCVPPRDVRWPPLVTTTLPSTPP